MAFALVGGGCSDSSNPTTAPSQSTNPSDPGQAVEHDPIGYGDDSLELANAGAGSIDSNGVATIHLATRDTQEIHLGSGGAVDLATASPIQIEGAETNTVAIEIRIDDGVPTAEGFVDFISDRSTLRVWVIGSGEEFMVGGTGGLTALRSAWFEQHIDQIDPAELDRLRLEATDNSSIPAIPAAQANAAVLPLAPPEPRGAAVNLQLTQTQQIDPTPGADEIAIVGTINWSDVDGGQHPWRNGEVGIWVDGDEHPVRAVTDAAGRYLIIVPHSDVANRSTVVRALTDGANPVKAPGKIGLGGVHQVRALPDDTIENPEPGATYEVSFAGDPANEGGQAMAIHQYIDIGAAYAGGLGFGIRPVTVEYPSERTIKYRDLLRSHIGIAQHDWGLVDVALHEYGHHVREEVLAGASPGGDHSVFESSAATRGWDAGNRLAYDEGLADLFSEVAQAESAAALAGVPDAADGRQSRSARFNGNRIQVSYPAEFAQAIHPEAPNIPTGEDNSVTVFRMLWDLYDPNDDDGDTVSFGGSLWNALLTSSTLREAVAKLGGADSEEGIASRCVISHWDAAPAAVPGFRGGEIEVPITLRWQPGGSAAEEFQFSQFTVQVLSGDERNGAASATVATTFDLSQRTELTLSGDDLLALIADGDPSLSYTWEIVASADGDAAYTSCRYPLIAAGDVAALLELIGNTPGGGSTGTTVGGGPIILESNDPAAIHVETLRSSFEVLPGVTFHLYKGQTVDGEIVPGELVLTGTTDDGGDFRWEGPNGTYCVTIETPAGLHRLRDGDSGPLWVKSNTTQCDSGGAMKFAEVYAKVSADACRVHGCE